MVHPGTSYTWPPGTPTAANYNQIEIVFSVIQRKVLTPNDFPSLQAVVERLDAFEHHYNEVARPFEWTFTRRDLADLLARVADRATAQARRLITTGVTAATTKPGNGQMQDQGAGPSCLA